MMLTPLIEVQRCYFEADRTRETIDTPHPKYKMSLGLMSLLMRPNIDINWAIHGRIKDYQEANDLDLSEAYKEVLTAGLDTLEAQDQQRWVDDSAEHTRFTPTVNVGTLSLL